MSAEKLRAEQTAQATRLAELSTELDECDRRCSQLQTGRDELEKRIDERSREHEALQDKIRAVQRRQEAAAHQAKSHDHRAEDQRGHAAEARQRREDLAQNQAAKEAALAASRARVEQLESELVELSKELEVRKAKVKAAQARVRELLGLREQVRQRVLELMNERTRTRNAAHDMRGHLKALDGRRAGLLQRQESLDDELTAVDRQACALAEDLRRRECELEAADVEERMILAELTAVDSEAAELARRESELRQQWSSIRGRLQVLADMESHMEGLDQGPKYLLERKPPGLQGRLIDLLDTDLEYSGALEAALGPYLQALLVETRAHADAMHEMLRREGKGRALLLVEREIPDDLLLERLPYGMDPESTRSLVSLVRFPSYAKCLVNWLLRGVCLVESLADGRPARHDICYVTPRGDLMCGPRIEGGSAEGQGGLLVRKASMQALTAEADALRRELEGLETDRERIEDLAESLRGETQEISALQQEARAGVHGRKAQAEHLREQMVAGERNLDELQLEIDELDRQRAVTRAQMTELLFQAFCTGRQEKRESRKETEVAGELSAAQASAESLGREEQELQLRAVACRSERAAARDACRMHEQALREFKHNAEALTRREEDSLRSADDHVSKATVCRAEAAGYDGELASVGETRDAAAGALASARAELMAHKEELTERQAAREKVAEAITQMRLSLGEVDHQFTWLESRLFEDVGIALRRCMGEVEGQGHVLQRIFGPPPNPGAVLQLLGPPVPDAMLSDERALCRLWEADDFDADSCSKDAEVVQARMERLGSVNLDAVNELADEEAGFEQAERDVADLTEARTSLVEALRRMERESRTLFEETFRLARSNFQAIFRKLFQGGRADMFLADEEDSLEGGIEIVARPPGKELQSINLLSGGERTLTALAILFAVFKVKPSPFCILDEVDAALDDTNVERFLRVLNDFVGPTQFCIVTHHKRTMGACDMLYGVTMQRRGVSSRIAVNLEQVDELTETGLGTNGTNGAGSKPKQRVAGEEAIGF